jgi:hypothetical protein
MTKPLQTKVAPVEWLTWDQTLRLLKAANVGALPWRVLADWCGQGLIETKATTIIAAGEVKRNERIVPELWRLCEATPGMLDIMGGSIKWVWQELGKAEGSSMTIMGTQFRKDQVLDLVSHVDKPKIDEALRDAEGWLGSGGRVINLTPVQPAAPVEQPKSNAGRKPDLDRWHIFYRHLVEIAQEGRLNGECFRSGAALQEELLDMMGRDAFHPDSIKATVNQIYKRFIAQ